MALAFCLIKKAQPILVARNGIGTTKNVLNAQPDGLSIKKEFVLLLIITVQHGDHMDSVLHVTLGMQLIKANVRPLMLCANHLDLMDLALLATTVMFFLESNVFQFQS